MADKRLVGIFSAGCAVCEETVSLVRDIACASCDVSILNMKEPEVAARAKSLGIHSLPAVAIDGKLADCCAGRGPNGGMLREAGIGKPL